MMPQKVEMGHGEDHGVDRSLQVRAGADPRHGQQGSGFLRGEQRRARDGARSLFLSKNIHFILECDGWLGQTERSGWKCFFFSILKHCAFS